MRKHRWLKRSSPVRLLRTAVAALSFCAIAVPVVAQTVIPVDSAGLATGKYELHKKQWQARLGDDPSWKLPSFNDAGWATLAMEQPLPDTVRLRLLERGPDDPGIMWFRIHLRVDSAQPRRTLMLWENYTPGEVYLNGTLLGARGNPAAAAATNAPFNTAPFEFELPPGDVLIAVRINAASLMRENSGRGPFSLILSSLVGAHRLTGFIRQSATWLGMASGILLALGGLHLLMYAAMRHRRAHLYYAGYALTLGIGFIMNLVSYNAVTVHEHLPIYLWSLSIVGTSFMILPLFLYSTFGSRVPRYYWIAFVMHALILCVLRFNLINDMPQVVYAPVLQIATFILLLSLLEAMRVILNAIRHRNDGARILVVGCAITVAVFGYGIWPLVFRGGAIRDLEFWMWTVGLVALPVSSSIYLVREITRTSRGFERLSKNLEEEVAVRTEQLREARVIADEANSAKSQFLANMSHELRTPLNAIIGYSEMLVEEAHDIKQETMATDLVRINTSGKHLLGLINDVLDLSKVEAGRMEIVLDEFDVEQMITDVSSTIQPLLAKNHNSLVTHVAHDAGRMTADSVKVRQILFNLLSNASKFTSDGTIRLSARCEGGCVIFEVSDTGVGMTAEQMSKLFQPFAQAESDTSRKFGGTGLGLAISRRFAELMGGTIEVSSEAGKGTTFVVTLPADVRVPT